MAVPIAELFISVSADVTAAISGLNSLQNKLQGTKNSLAQATPAALALTGAATGIGAGFLSAVKVAATFEQAMSGVRAVMSPDEAKQFGGALDDLAVSLGASSKFTATEVAGAFESLLKLGVSAPAILGGAGAAALGLAAATGAPIDDAATVAAQALNAFHLQVSDLPDVVDQLAGVINVTAADLNDIKLGFSDVAAVAHGMGLSFLDTAVTLGIFRDNALTGNTAGTALKTMLTGLQPTTKQQKNLFDQLGLTVNGANNAFFDAQGNVRDMASISEVLNKALGGMTKQQRAATLETLFGTQGMLAANIIMDTGAERIRQYTADVKKISAADQAAERLNNLLGRMEQLGGAIQSVQIKIGNLFLPALSAITLAVQGVVQAFLAFTPEQQRTAALFVALTGAVAGAIGGAVLLAAGWSFLGPSFLAVGKVILGLVPIFRVVALVAGVLAAAWATNLFGIQEKVQAALGLIPAILDKVSQAFDAAGSFWETAIMPAISTIANAIEQRVLPVFNNLANRIGPLLSHFGVLIQKAFSGDVGGAVDSFISIMGTLFPTIRDPLVAIRTAIGNFAAVAGPVLGILGQVFERVFAGNISGALGLFRDLMVDLIPVLGPVLTILGNIANSVGPLVAATFATLADAVGGFAAGAGEGFSTFFTQTLPPILDTIGGVAADLGQGLLTFFDTVVKPVGEQALAFAGDIGSGLRVFFTETLPPVLDTVGRFAGEVGADLLAFFNTALPAVRDAAAAFGADVGAGLTTFFTVTMPPILEAVGNFAGDVGANFIAFFRDHLPAVADVLDRFGSNPGAAFLSFFRDNIPAVIASLSTFTADTTAELVNFFTNKAPQIIAGLQLFTPEAAKPLLAFFTNFDIIKAQVESLAPLFGAIAEFGASLARLDLAILSLGQRSIAPIFEQIRAGADAIFGPASAAAPALNTLSGSLDLIGPKLESVRKFFSDAAAAVNDFAAAVEKTPAPNAPAGAGGGGGLQFDPGAFFRPGAPPFGEGGLFHTGFGGQGGGPLISIGQLIISSEAEAQAFLDQMAAAVRGSAGRVNTPPDNSGNPQLVPSFA